MHFDDLLLAELRNRWEKVWGVKPHRSIGRKMMTRSLIYKMREQEGFGLSPDHQKR